MPAGPRRSKPLRIQDGALRSGVARVGRESARWAVRRKPGRRFRRSSRFRHADRPGCSVWSARQVVLQRRVQRWQEPLLPGPVHIVWRGDGIVLRQSSMQPWRGMRTGQMRALWQLEPALLRRPVHRRKECVHEWELCSLPCESERCVLREQLMRGRCLSSGTLRATKLPGPCRQLRAATERELLHVAAGEGRN